ncbi:uncharacterized protein N7482_006746 [Penicillium canariense]|uniref:Uncharacterized protein n=1 Tax=Penicillium canariense TaxID=189055 RepID=A0A9W9HVI8_9EURO|nr:uncharacterized protein N7482_006746 [Penicillium canariense]KAJ5159742.1 hypothetical protein N7482_006746 [Penicillium canariense]
MDQPRKKKKLSTQDNRRLVLHHKINFEGPIPSARWPQNHSAIFTAIRKIEDVRYDTYLEESHSDLPHGSHKAKLVSKARKLVLDAYACRNSNTNEGTWRSKTETPLLRKFEEEMECGKCNQRRLPSYRVELIFPNEAQRSQAIETEQALCKCIGDDANEDNTALSHSAFAGKLHAGISDPLVPEIGIKYPDHVIGLQRSTSLNAALQRHPGLVSDPVKDAADIFLNDRAPDLLLSRRRQLSLSKDSLIFKKLSENGKTNQRKTLWFGSWHSVVMNGESIFRIIDVWHGCILRHDCALQLCLIVELICDWAWDIYRKDIIQLLSIGPEVISGNFGSKLSGANKAKDFHSESSASLKQNSVIRDTNEVFFSFRHLTLPELMDDLTAILKPPRSGFREVNQNAIKLLDLFNLERPLLLPTRFISCLETLWTGANRKHPILDSDELVCVHISFRSYFRPCDYHIIRQISCITASSGSMDTLQRLTGTKHSVFPGSSDSLTKPEVVLPLVELSGLESLRAAARDLRLTLSVNKNSSGLALPCNWAQESSGGAFVSSLWDNLASFSPEILLFPIFVHSREMRRIPAGQGSCHSLQVFFKQGRHVLLHGAAILKTPRHLLRPLYPEYCLVVFDGSDLDDRPGLGRKLLQLVASNSLFEGKSLCKVTAQDRRSIHDWATRLKESNG